MMQVYVDWRKVLPFVLIVALLAAFPLVWKIQSTGMEGEFVNALKQGCVKQLPPHLLNKQWTETDTATVTVRKLPRMTGRRGHVTEAIYSLGQHTLPSDTYSFQASAVDTATGLKFVFGRLRSAPGTWMWAGVHPDSMDQWIQQRGEEAQAMEGKRVPVE